MRISFRQIVALSGYRIEYPEGTAALSRPPLSDIASQHKSARRRIRTRNPDFASVSPNINAILKDAVENSSTADNGPYLAAIDPEVLLTDEEVRYLRKYEARLYDIRKADVVVSRRMSLPDYIEAFWINNVDSVSYDRLGTRYRAVDLNEKQMPSILNRLSRIRNDEDIVKFANQFGPLGLPSNRTDRLTLEFSAFANAPSVIYDVHEKRGDWYGIAGEMEYIANLIKIEQADQLQWLAPMAQSMCVGMISPVLRNGEVTLVAHSLLASLWAYILEVASGTTKLGFCQNPNCKKEPFYPVGIEKGKRARQARYCSNNCRNAVNNATKKAKRENPNHGAMPKENVDSYVDTSVNNQHQQT